MREQRSPLFTPSRPASHRFDSACCHLRHLTQHPKGIVHEDSCTRPTPPLDWTPRRKIARAVASATTGAHATRPQTPTVDPCLAHPRQGRADLSRSHPRLLTTFIRLSIYGGGAGRLSWYRGITGAGPLAIGSSFRSGGFVSSATGLACSLLRSSRMGSQRWMSLIPGPGRRQDGSRRGRRPQYKSSVEPVRSDGRSLVIRPVWVLEQPAVELGLVVQVAQHALAHLLKSWLAGPEERSPPPVAVARRGVPSVGGVGGSSRLGDRIRHDRRGDGRLLFLATLVDHSGRDRSRSRPVSDHRHRNRRADDGDEYHGTVSCGTSSRDGFSSAGRYDDER